MSKHIFRLCIASLPFTGFITLANLAEENFTWYFWTNFILFGLAACLISMYIPEK